MSALKSWVCIGIVGFLCVALAGCEKKQDTAKEPALAALEEVVAKVPAGKVTPEVEVRFLVPGDWKTSELFPLVWTRKGNRVDASLEVSTGCSGACVADAIAGQIQRELATPAVHLNKGMAAHLVPKVKVLARGNTDHGRFVAYRLTYAEPPEGELGMEPEIRMDCYLHRDKDPFFVLLEARGAMKHEERIWPRLRESCEAASYTLAVSE